MKQNTQEAAFRQRVLEYQQNQHTVTETANRYHLSRKTVHKWRNRWDGTPKSLQDQSRKPKRSPRKQTEEEIRLVKRLAKKYKWQDHILAYQGALERGYTRCFGCFTRTVRKLQERKPKRSKKKRKNKPYQRADYPGQKVQVDVKYVPSDCVSTTNTQQWMNAADGRTGICMTSTAQKVQFSFCISWLKKLRSRLSEFRQTTVMNGQSNCNRQIISVYQ